MLPSGGNVLVINGLPQVIPSAGVTLNYIVNSVLQAPNTLLYIYAYMSGVTMMLEASATGYTTDGSGRNNKTGDTTRRLVGMVYTTGASLFRDDPAFRGVLNWFNQRDVLIDLTLQSFTIVGPTYLQTYYTTTSGITFLCWAGGLTRVTSNMVFGAASPLFQSTWMNQIDGSSFPSGAFYSSYPINTSSANPAGFGGYQSNYGLLSEGAHTFQAYISSYEGVNGGSSATVTGELYGNHQGVSCDGPYRTIVFL